MGRARRHQPSTRSRSSFCCHCLFRLESVRREQSILHLPLTLPHTSPHPQLYTRGRLLLGEALGARAASGVARLPRLTGDALGARAAVAGAAARFAAALFS